MNLPAPRCQQWMDMLELNKCRKCIAHVFHCSYFLLPNSSALPLQPLNGRNIRVSYANDRPSAPRSNYGGGGGGYGSRGGT
ncbi:hypothetical protein ACSBR1_013057 [Camellia fascicularis]